MFNPSTNVEIYPRGYDLAFYYRDAVNEDQHYKLTLKVSQPRLGRLVEIVHFHQLGYRRLKTVVAIPTSLNIWMDCDVQDNVDLNKLESTECFVVLDNDQVMLYLAGLPHGVQLPFADFEKHVRDLYSEMTGYVMQTHSAEQFRIGAVELDDIDGGDLSFHYHPTFSNRGNLYMFGNEVILARSKAITPTRCRLILPEAARYIVDAEGYLTMASSAVAGYRGAPFYRAVSIGEIKLT